ncbi:AI-2E family transporter [Schnuerera sp. xch1]|uniref:AI-2E family transporter n=1 Tax=Schnuerera sp. xch1 TaxID=2874283 RepID=UPI001CBFDE71|nr:AI-2E family transporter [Schnuerera sp. xch1]MBZ2175934.1 AI-2E family transporter [Schnuerera sp. xch1]
MEKIEKKFSYIKYFILLVSSLIIWKIIDSPGILNTIMNILKPFVWAFIIAFVLNSLLTILELNFSLKRWMNIIIVYIIFYGIIVLAITIITPRVIESMLNIGKEIPNYAHMTQEWLSRVPDYLMEIDNYGLIDFIQSTINDLFSRLGDGISIIIDRTLMQVISITSLLINFILGSFISIYMLMDKEYFAKNLTRLIYAIFPVKKADWIIELASDTNEAFSKFLVGKLLDSLIIGVLCFIGCNILGIKYATLISIIVGITNMIPYFGPFIGMIPSVIITLFDRPLKALIVLIFIFILQQFDGWYLGPKILGGRVGVKPFWIMLSILIGGGFFGMWGMLFAVPITAVIKNILQKYIIKQHEKKGVTLNNK